MNGSPVSRHLGNEEWIISPFASNLCSPLSICLWIQEIGIFELRENGVMCGCWFLEDGNCGYTSAMARDMKRKSGVSFIVINA